MSVCVRQFLFLLLFLQSFRVFFTGHVKVCASFFNIFFYWWCCSDCNFYFYFLIIPSSTLISSREVWPTARWDFACATVSLHQCSTCMHAGQCGSVPRGAPLRHWGSCTTRQPFDSDPAAAVVLLNVLGCRGCRLIGTILATSWDQCVSMVQYSFTSTETRRLVMTESPGRPPRLSHSSCHITLVKYPHSKHRFPAVGGRMS